MSARVPVPRADNDEMTTTQRLDHSSIRSIAMYQLQAEHLALAQHQRLEQAERERLARRLRAHRRAQRRLRRAQHAAHRARLLLASL